LYLILSTWISEVRAKFLRQNPTTKARNLENTKKGLVFYITPSSFVLSYFRVFVIRGFFYIMDTVFCFLI